MPTREQLIGALRQADAAGDTDAALRFAGMLQQGQGDAAPAQPPAAPAPAASGSLYTGLHNAANTATFGLADKASAALASGISHVMPGATPMSYDEARQRIAAQSASDDDANPISAMVGTGAGMVAQGAGIGAGIGAAARAGVPLLSRAATALLPTAETGLPGLIGKGAATGALASTAGAEVNNLTGDNQDLLTAGLEGAAGGVIGAGIGKVAGSVYSRVANSDIGGAGMRAWRIIADKLGESPDDLQAAAQAYTHWTGQQPNLTQIVGLSTQGAIKDMASEYGTIANRLAQARDTNAAAVPDVLQQQMTQRMGRATSATELEGIRNQNMNDALNPIRDQPVPLSGADHDLLTSDHVRQAVRGNRQLRGRINDFVDAVTYEDPQTGRTFVDPNAQHNGLTVGDLDHLRQNLRGLATRALSNADAAQISNTANQVRQLGPPEYDAALTRYGNQSEVIENMPAGAAEQTNEATVTGAPLRQGPAQAGYGAGLNASLQGDAAAGPASALRVAGRLADDQGLQSAIASAYGRDTAGELANVGAQVRQGQRALSNVAPSGPVGPDGNGADLYHLGQAVAIGAAHSAAGVISHLAKVLPGVMTGRMPVSVQQRVAQYLTDPNMSTQGINLLRRAGATNAQIRQLIAGTAAAAGIATDEAMNP